MQTPGKRAQFERVVLPHLDAAYNLARWLTRNDHDAEDVMQEASVRAYRFFESFRGGNPKAWLLTIVRHTCYTWLEANRAGASMTAFDEQIHSPACHDSPGIGGESYTAPETLLWQVTETRWLQRYLEELPLEYREVVILRELEGCSYKEIGEIAGIPLGTVMSRLARGRSLLQQKFSARVEKEP